MLNFENLDKFNFISTGDYDLPMLDEMLINYDVENLKQTQWIPFNYVLSTKEEDKAGKGVHFFVDDYQFIRVWNNPDKYLDKLKGFDYVLTPDFSTYTDMPKALQIYNMYRKQWLGCYWQMHGIKVIPTVSWSTADNHNWIFEGIPKNSIVAVSTVGCMQNKDFREKFFEGCRKAIQVLEPNIILCYGSIPDRFKNSVIEIGHFSKEMQKRILKNGR
ncbi:MAG: DUF4417 domain-containing protein [Eubacteriales bacterium]|nr:DUF4417 domain-containing protein [Eubacteriales bacterium]